MTMARVTARSGIGRDKRFDEKIPGLSIEVYPSGKITFFVYKNINMYNKKKNVWAPNVIYKKMFVWARNTGFNCEAAREKAAAYLDQITDSRSKTNDEITVEYLVKKFIKTGMNGFTLRDESQTYKEDVKRKYIANLTRIQSEARAKGQYGVAAKCEELKGKVQVFYVDRNLTLTKELSDDDIHQKMKDIFKTREEYDAMHKSLDDELFEKEVKVEEDDKS